jgi:hypothetical protein
MISASSRRSHVALSSSPSNSVADLGAQPARLGEVLAQAAEEAAAALRPSAAGAATVAPSPVMKTSVQSRASAVRR